MGEMSGGGEEEAEEAEEGEEGEEDAGEEEDVGVVPRQ